MHKPANLIPASLFFLLFAAPHLAKANNAAAGEISYEWIADSTYRFYFKFYSDCSGNAEPATVPLCFHNPCNNAQSFSVTLNKMSGSGTLVAVGCSRAKTQCDSAASTLPGYKEWVYSELVSLPGRCNAWHIYTHVGNRNGSLNIQNATSKAYYAEARFNNTGSYRINSSPYFTTKPVMYMPLNQPSMYNSNALDADGDSLVTEIINPLTGVSSCADTVPANVTYVSATPGIAIPSNPFQTNQTFTVDAATGELRFIAAQAGKNAAALRIKEYRNGVLIGSVTRDIQPQVMPFISTAPLFKYSIPTGKITVCAGKLLTFTWSVYSKDTNAILWGTDNHASGLPGATVTYTNQGSDSVTGTLSWTPALSDVGNHSLVAITSDSTCNPPGMAPLYPTFFPIEVFGDLKANRDTTICLGDSIQMNATGGDGTYYWQELPNSNPGRISCGACKNPYMTPNVNAVYEVVSGNGCPPVRRDTVAVNVLTNLTYPTIAITMDPDTGITPATKVSFTATMTGCNNPVYTWFFNGQELTGISGATFSRSGFSDNDKIYCVLHCKDTCPRPFESYSNDLFINHPLDISKLNNKYNISLYPNPNNGSFTLSAKLPDDQYQIEILNTLGQTIYRKNVSIHNNELKEQIHLDVPAGMYLLKLNNDVQRFIVNDR